MKKVLKTIGVVVISIATLAIMAFGLNSCTKEKTTKVIYSLDEINNGVYAIYYTTHSRASAYNYDVVTLNCNGNIKTFKGNVNITYTTDEPHTDITHSNYINNDKIYVYILKGSIEYARDVGIE